MNIRAGTRGPHLLFAMLRQRPAIVHFMVPEAYLVGALLAKIARIPIRIMNRRRLNLYQKTWLVRKMERWLHHSMDAVFGNSRNVIRQLKEYEGVPADRLGPLYNGINTDAFAILCMIANLIPYKGHADLIVAPALAANKCPKSGACFWLAVTTTSVQG
jgi:glycosyl transferase family 4